MHGQRGSGENIGKGIITGVLASATVSGAVVLTAVTGLTQASDPVQRVSAVMLTQP
jgi:hypothetical protein